jgi:hypothetical protein
MTSAVTTVATIALPVAARARPVVRTPGDIARVIIRRMLRSSMVCRMSLKTRHLGETSFLQGEPRTGLVKIRKRVALTNERGNRLVGGRKARDELENQTVILHRRTNIRQLISKLLETLTVRGDIGKCIHASRGELLLKGDGAGVLVVSKKAG